MVVSSSSAAGGDSSSSNGLSLRGGKLKHWHCYFEGIRRQLTCME